MTDTLIASVSGVRGIVGKDLTPELVARYAAAFGQLAREADGRVVLLGRDSRTSGPMLAAAARAGLQSVGVSVVDCGLVPTPTLQLAVEHHGAAGGIVLTASHNPVEWNALKFVGSDGLFLDRDSAGRLFQRVESGDIGRSSWDDIGGSDRDDGAVSRHLDQVLQLNLISPERIRGRRFKVALDCVRGAGGTIMPALLERLGCEVVGMDLETDGRFPRAPEPVPGNLSALSALVESSGADLGMAVDPDVDRLAVLDENGRPVGEDYTLAFAVRAVLAQAEGVVVTNLSTSLVVDDAAKSFGAGLVRAPVGEANVAHAMKASAAVIGGEGNGGVMLPELHLGRDAPVAAALVLDLLGQTGQSVAQLVSAAPEYCIEKAKANRRGELDEAYTQLKARFADAEIDLQDGLRLTWPGSWLHVRPSGTEPIVRFVAEAHDEKVANELIEIARDTLDRT